MFYVVLEIDSGERLYDGQNIQEAANHLNPGTCYGAANLRLDANERARQARKRFLLGTAPARKPADQGAGTGLPALSGVTPAVEGTQRSVNNHGGSSDVGIETEVRGIGSDPNKRR